jgi:tetrapyrrole methylase family protein / MazG family protein
MTVKDQKTSQAGITLLGLGPGDPAMLTRQAWDWLAGIDRLYLRTSQHPTVAHLPVHLVLESFDHLYERYDDFAQVYEAIVEAVLALGNVAPVTYAVPGHPFIAEATCPEIARRAAAAGIPVQVIDGLSFLEPTCRALGMDPFPGLMLADAMEIALRQTPGFPPSAPALIAQIYDRDVAAELKLTLMAAYPDEHPVRLVHAAGTKDGRVEDLPLHAIDKSPQIGLLSTLYIPPLGPQSSFEAFQEVIAKLRSPEGCPWDREQTHLSLRPFLLEEAYETLDALDREDMADLAEELGDLLLQILLHAQIATEDGDFNIHHVIEGIATKLIRRHPHVFSAVEVAGVDGVIRNWEQIKAEERQAHASTEKNGLLEGVPAALPALSQAEQIIERVGRVGFQYLAELGDIKAVQGILEAMGETTTPGTKTRLGELLLAVTSLAHKADLDAESALREVLVHFRERFHTVEAQVLAEGRTLMALSADEWLRLWADADDVGQRKAGK